jgi:5-methyltetrahydrofolate--homocysteine methyltransferase
MIGGATTSERTAVKIAPQYKSTVVHVNDSRAVTVAGYWIKTKKYMQAILEPNMMRLEKPFEPFSKTI